MHYFRISLVLKSTLYESWRLRGWLTCLICFLLEFPGSIQKAGFTQQHTLLRSKDLQGLMLLKQGCRTFSPSVAVHYLTLLSSGMGPLGTRICEPWWTVLQFGLASVVLLSLLRFWDFLARILIVDSTRKFRFDFRSEGMITRHWSLVASPWYTCKYIRLQNTGSLLIQDETCISLGI